MIASTCRHLGRLALTVTALGAGFFALATAASAKRTEPVVRGLDNPRGIVVLPGGRLAVAEAGHAGSACLGEGQCLGLNGRVSVIGRNGRRVTVASGLPSFAGPFAAFGLGGLALQRGRIHFVEGLNPQSFGNPDETCPAGSGHDRCATALRSAQKQFGALGRVKSLSRNRGWQKLAAVGRFDFNYATAHPDPGNPEYAPGDANPFGLLPSRAGGFYVVDAASNTLDLVTRRGRTSVLAFVPDPPDHKPIYDAAPTCVARGRGGDLFIATESNSVWRWNGKRLTEVISGGKIGQAIACDSDRHGNIYFANLTRLVRGHFPDFELTPNDGSIVKLDRRLKTSYVATGLNFPTGLAVARDGSLYVALDGLCPSDRSLLNSNNSPPGACPHSGRIVRIRP